MLILSHTDFAMHIGSSFYVERDNSKTLGSVYIINKSEKGGGDF